MTWTDHADYLDSLADEHRDDAPKPHAPAPIAWTITWWHADDDDPGHDRHTTRTVLAGPPNGTDYTENNTAAACPEGMRRWAEWIGTSNYGTALVAIDYAVESLTDLTGVTFDQYGTPQLRTMWSSTTIHTERFDR